MQKNLATGRLEEIIVRTKLKIVIVSNNDSVYGITGLIFKKMK